ncbi:hypothetical protein EU527_14355 [Candidatus Thorarchaeota archaeon]|nr:MAG: hypothetical protein EU527_14355 [Candidatus Thorarchaeota archaeon]
MEIPILTRFIKGLKLFFESKRLKWFFGIFIFATIFTLLFREIGRIFPSFAQGFIAVIGGIFPTFFLIAAIMSMLGLQRFVASEEAYSRSLIYTIIWMIVSIFLYIMLWFTGLVFYIMIGVAFLGWIGFQAYLSSRSALGYAEKVDVKSRSRIVKFAFGSLHVLSYIIIIGSFIVLAIWNISTAGGLDLPTAIAALLGTALALGFNFLNGLIIIRERNKVTVDNLSVLGLFVSLYVAYFLYNILKPVTTGIDPVSLVIDIGISSFFLLYAMSNVGLTLASRAHLETRLKISSELAATITFFLASGYLVVQALFDVSSELSGVLIGERLPDIIKLLVFPFVALIMEILFIRRAGKVLQPMPIAEPLEQPQEDEELDEVVEDLTDVDDVYTEPEDSSVEMVEEEVESEEDADSVDD